MPQLSQRLVLKPFKYGKRLYLVSVEVILAFRGALADVIFDSCFTTACRFVGWSAVAIVFNRDDTPDPANPKIRTLLCNGSPGRDGLNLSKSPISVIFCSCWWKLWGRF